MKFFLFLSLLVSFSLDARNFYQSTFEATLHYAHIDSGTKEVFKNVKVEVRYSDDHDKCRIKLGSIEIPCHTFHPNSEPKDAKITLDRGPLKKLVLELATKYECKKELKEKLDRLLNYLDDSIDLEFIGTDFYQEVHDEQDEVFHLWLFNLDQGKKL